MTTSRLGVPALLGIPFDGESSYLRGAGDAPLKIRAALRCDAGNMWTELGVNLGVVAAFEDAGDLEIVEGHQSHDMDKNPHFSQKQGEMGHPNTQSVFAAIENRVGTLI